MTSVEASEKDKFKEVCDDIGETIDSGIKSNIEQHNIVFRQMAAQLILVAGILLALSTQITSQLSTASLLIKIFVLVIITLLNFSILFGILQHFMEAEFFKKLALGKRKIKKDIPLKQDKDLFKLFGAMSKFEEMSGTGTKRWPTIVQIILLSIAIFLISITATIRLFE